ncbi:PQQ-like beta-propeller repeat protein [Paenibacillus sp. GSMTC-2017]|uniref:PQQ-like beta-propeller repeat protein n=1 Tax=Paenibacillus sp. GSMTC-2017 TaxID=2794350 RepID=UPI0018D945E6|nr:PQQ-binding-like beta-propeller repeat protein [Paenibacillus sp. GSMTC-2017]MBH5318041.1 PQQ-like beta-propeller repeat protein [Paenibacillus sp. GSMTC-2017]
MRNYWTVMIVMVLVVIGAGCSNGSKGNEGKEGEVSNEYRGDIQNTGVFEASGLPKLTGLKWKFKLNEKTNSSPVLSGNLLYIGDEEGTFYAINTSDGSKKWTFKANGKIRSSATVVNDSVYFMDGSSTMYALEASSGTVIWENKLDDSLANQIISDHWDYYISSPAIVEDTIYIGSEGKSFYALNRINGEIKWTFNTESAVHGKAVVAEDKVFIAEFSGAVTALEQSSGKKLWSINHGLLHGGLAYKEGILYYGSRDQFVYGTKGETGEVLWSYQSPSGSWLGSSAAVNDKFVVIGSSDANVVHVFDRTSNKLVFDFKVEKTRVFGSPSIAGNIVYFGTAYTETINPRDAFYAVDLDTGKELWRYEGGKFPILSSPVIGDGVIYYSSQDGYVNALH